MAIEFHSINKTFGKTRALDGVTLTLEEGRIYGLLGNNGAGKSTLLSSLTDRQRPDSGQVFIDGMPVKDNDEALGRIFMVGEQNYFSDEMKIKHAFQAAELFYPNFDKAYAEELAKQFGLPLKKKIVGLSTGYSSIFRLILGLSVNTPYVAFDEPVLGLDAQNRDLFYRLLVEKYAEGNTTFIISTHLIAEVENLIEHTVILREGKILRDAPTDHLTESAYSISGPAGLVDDYTADKTVLTSHSLGGLKTVSIQGTPEGKLPLGLESSRMSLQDYFISLQEAEDAAKQRKEREQ